MPTLRSQIVASALGNAKKSSEQGDATIEASTALSNSSPPCLGPGTPAQDHEAAVPNSDPVIRRSRRLSAMGAVEDALGLPPRKANRREALASRAGGESLPIDEFNKGKRKAEKHLDEAFSCEKEESSPGSFHSQVGLDFSSPAFVRKASHREGLSSSSKGNGKGRVSGGLEAMLGDGIFDRQRKQPLPFDLNQSSLGSSSSDEVCEAPNPERLLEAGQVSVHLNFDSAEDGDVTMLAEEHEKKAAAYLVVEDSNVSSSLSDLEAGTSHRPQAEVGRQGRGRGRGRGRSGGAEASRSRFLQIARDCAFHFAHFNADGDEAPAGVPPQSANGRRRGRPPRQLNQNRPQPPPQTQQVDLLGPLSTARQLVNNRAEATAACQNATERLLAAGQVSVPLDFDSAEDGDVTMLAEEHEEEAAAHQVVEDSNVSPSLSDLEAGPSHRPQAEVGRPGRGRGRGRRGGAEASRSRFLQIARDRAFHFAHFNADGDEAPAGVPPQAANGRRRGRPPRQLNQNRPQPPRQAQQVDWPGPFSTARQLVNNRAEATAARQNACAPGNKVSLVDWHPTRVHGDSVFCSRKCPSLQDLCLRVLSNNAENVVSLEGVPELFRCRISNAFCERRKLNSKVLSLFFQGEPSELHSLDCTQISEDELTAMMKQISPSRLENLHLDNCGRALSERCLLATIASPSTVTLLKSISLRGAYRLSDGGLEVLLQASPQLVHLDLSTCSFLTNASIKAIACCVGGTLESLVLDGCPNLNATAFVHDLVRLQKVQKISLAEVGGVTDEIVSEICVQLGSHLRELVLARCNALTDVAIAAIGPCCPSLQVLDLAHLSLLTDVAIAHITDNLRKIQFLNVRRCKFSDEAIAAFVTASGAVLRNLSLNAVHQVADQTILALARHSHACLEYLDLSFCRLVDDECLGFLADACVQLQELKLYGCTQVTDKFLNGHSNLNIKVVGLRSSV